MRHLPFVFLVCCIPNTDLDPRVKIACDGPATCPPDYVCSPSKRQCEKVRAPAAPTLTAALPTRDPSIIRLTLRVTDDNSDAVTVTWKATSNGVEAILPDLSVQADSAGVDVPVELPLVELFGNTLLRNDVRLDGTVTDAAHQTTFEIGPFTAGNDAPAIDLVTLSTQEVRGVALLTLRISDSSSDAVNLTDVRLSLTGSLEDAVPLALDDATFPAGSRAGLVTTPAGENHTFAWDSTTAGMNASDTATLFLRVSDSASSEWAHADFALFNNEAPVIQNIRVGSTSYRRANGLVDVSFDLTDAEGDLSSVTCEYSLDLGLTHLPCREAALPWGDILRDLPASRVTFVWDTSGLSFASTRTTALRLTPSDGLSHIASSAVAINLPFSVGPVVRPENARSFTGVAGGVSIINGPGKRYITFGNTIAAIEGSLMSLTDNAGGYGFSGNPAAVQNVNGGIDMATLNEGRDLVLLTASQVTVWPEFDEPVTPGFAISGPVERVRAGDLDGDGVDDIAVIATDGAVTIWIDNGTPLTAQACAAPKAAAIFGGHLVLACTDGSLQRLRVEAAMIVVAPAITLAEAASHLVPAKGALLHVLTSLRGYTFTASFEALPAMPLWPFPPSFATAGDVDGDGVDELAYCGEGTEIVLHRFVSPEGLVSGEVLEGTRSTLDELLAGDANRDGRDELWAIGGPPVTVYHHDHATVPSTNALSPSEPIRSLPGGYELCFADFDQDGWLDIADSQGIENFQWLLTLQRRRPGPRDATDVFSRDPEIPRVVDDYYVFDMVCGDMSGDGIPDVLRTNSDLIERLDSDGLRFTSTIKEPTTATQWLLADIDGDGTLDPLGFSGETPTTAVVRLTAAGMVSLTSFPQTAQGAWAGDINGDGRIDLVASCAQSACLQVLRNNGTGFDAATYTGGVQGGQTFGADVDRDGDVDIMQYEDFANGDQTWVQWTQSASAFSEGPTGDLTRGLPFFFDADQSGTDDFVIVGPAGAVTPSIRFDDELAGFPITGDVVDLDRNGFPDVLGVLNNSLRIKRGDSQDLVTAWTRDGVTRLPAPADFTGKLRDFWPLVSRIADDHVPAQVWSRVYRVGAEQGLQVVMHDGIARRRPAARRTGSTQFDLPVFAGAPTNLTVYGLHMTWKLDDEGFLFEDKLIPIYEVVTASAVRDGSVLHVETEKTGDFAAVDRQ